MSKTELSDTDAESFWSEESFNHVDVIAADRVFVDNSDAVINYETRSVRVPPQHGVYFVFRDQVRIPRAVRNALPFDFELKRSHDLKLPTPSDFLDIIQALMTFCC